MKIKIIIAIGISLWLGGYAIKGVYVGEDIGKGISGIGWVVLATFFVFEVKRGYDKK